MVKKFILLVLLIPLLYACESNVMEPKSSETIFTFGFTLRVTAFVKIDIEDSYNNHVITLINNELQPAAYTVFWDFTDSNSVKVSEGIYIRKIYLNGRLEDSEEILFRN